MDVPLALNDIEVQIGFKGYTKESSTFYQLVDVLGFFSFYVDYHAEQW